MKANLPTKQLKADELLGVDVTQAPLTALVGRQRELDLLEDVLARVRDEHAAQLVTLVGVPGVGKSRLVWELLQAVEAEPELTIGRQGRCLPYGEGVALWALGEVVKAQAGILDTDPAELAQAKLNQTIAHLVTDEREMAWVEEHLRPLIGVGSAVELGGDRRAEAFAAWRRFLEALAEQGSTVLVVEDLHWADELLLDFLDHLVDWAADVPLLVVCTTRPELLARRPGWAGGKLNATTIGLSPLGPKDIARLVAGLLGQALLPAELQTALLSRAGGNPLYAEEYVHMLADRGFLRKVGGSWQLDRTEQLPLPEAIQGIIAARLDALEPAEKALLQDAAVLGKVAWVSALAALGDTEPSTLARPLHELERRELLRRERRSAVAGEHQYAFRHVLVRDVAYGQLPRAVRARKHQRAAQWLQELSPDRAEDRAELLAYHWQAALQHTRAAGEDSRGLAEPTRLALRDAGDRAKELNAFAAATRWYTAALELWPTDNSERPQLLLRLGRARRFAELAGGELLEEARDGLLVQGDREGAAEAEALLGQLLASKGQGQHAMEHNRRAVMLLQGQGPSPAKATVLANLVGSLLLQGRSEEAIQLGRQAVAMAEALGLEAQQAQALNFIGYGRVLGGDLGGVADLEQAVTVAVRANLPDSAGAYANLAGVLIAQGDLAHGFELQAMGREAAERFGLAGLRHFRAERTFQDYWQGRWDAAQDAADQFIVEAEAGSPHYMQVICRLVRELIRLARGDLPGALADGLRSVELATQIDEPEALLPTLAFHARALLANDQAEQAGARVDELLAGLIEYGAMPTHPDWSGQLAIVLDALGRTAELSQLAATVSTPTRWLQAATAMAAGDFARAADQYAEIGSRPDEAFARLQAAGQLLANRQRIQGTTQLQHALAFYREVRAGGYLQQAEALLAASA